MKFENRFLSFIKEKKSVCVAALAAVLVLLLLLGTDSEKTVEASGADSYGEMLEERVESSKLSSILLSPKPIESMGS